MHRYRISVGTVKRAESASRMLYFGTIWRLIDGKSDGKMPLSQKITGL